MLDFCYCVHNWPGGVGAVHLFVLLCCLSQFLADTYRATFSKHRNGCTGPQNDTLHKVNVSSKHVLGLGQYGQAQQHCCSTPHKDNALIIGSVINWALLVATEYDRH